MRSFLLTILLLITSVASAQVMTQEAQNNAGQTFIRFYNNSPSYYSCYYRDSYNNYYTFVLAPQLVSMWYPTYGYFEWECV